MQIRVYEEVTQEPRGDRDPQRHDCSAFSVYLVNGSKRSLIFSNNQFDPNWTTINGSRNEYLREAMKAAETFAETLGGCEIVGVELTKHEVRVKQLEKEIKERQIELDKLRKQVL